MHSQGKSFWGYMMGIQNVEDLLNFSNLEKGDAGRCRPRQISMTGPKWCFFHNFNAGGLNMIGDAKGDA